MPPTDITAISHLFIHDFQICINIWNQCHKSIELITLQLQRMDSIVGNRNKLPPFGTEPSDEISTSLVEWINRLLIWSRVFKDSIEIYLMYFWIYNELDVLIYRCVISFVCSVPHRIWYSRWVELLFKMINNFIKFVHNK